MHTFCNRNVHIHIDSCYIGCIRGPLSDALWDLFFTGCRRTMQRLRWASNGKSFKTHTDHCMSYIFQCGRALPLFHTVGDIWNIPIQISIPHRTMNYMDEQPTNQSNLISIKRARSNLLFMPPSRIEPRWPQVGSLRTSCIVCGISTKDYTGQLTVGWSFIHVEIRIRVWFIGQRS